MDQLISTLDSLTKNKNGDPAVFYTHLSNYVLTKAEEKPFSDNFIPQVYYLYEKQILKKDILYLYLLASENYNVLEKFLEYDKSVFVLNVKSPVSLFDYCIYKRQHWIYELVQNPSKYEEHLPGNISNYLYLIKFVVDSNLKDINLDSLISLSAQINLSVLDDFWRFYVQEINRYIDVAKFCKPLLKSPVSDYEIFTFATANSLLETLSNFADLSKTEHWDSIFAKLQSKEELDTFTGFAIFATLVKLVITDSNANLETAYVNKVFDNVKYWLLSLKNKCLQVELLENIYYLLFHRDRNEFICKEKEIRFILFLLKTVIEELQLKKHFQRNTPEHQKISSLSDKICDLLWRLDLIINTKKSPKIDERLLHYMLAPPESLINFCLKQKNFERAHQVIEIFNLRDSDFAKEILYTEKYHEFKKSPKNVEEFFEGTKEPFFGIFDFASTQTKTWDETSSLLQLAKSKKSLDDQTLKVYKRLAVIAEEIGPKEQLSLPQILTSCKYPLDLEAYKTKEEFFDGLEKLCSEFQLQMSEVSRGGFNRNHQSHNTLVKINKLVQTYNNGVPYLLRLFNYLKAFSKILYIEQNTSDIIAKGKNTSFFSLLNFNRSELTGKLLFERQLDPTEFEKYFKKLDLDFLYHVVGNCFPTINLHIQENVTVEELYHDNMLYVPSPSIIVYIQKRNWLLAFILSEMYHVEDVKIDVSEERLRHFLNYLKMPAIQNLKALFDKNDIITALQNCINPHKMKIFLREQIIDQDLNSIHSHNSDVETGEEILEDAKTTNWKRLYEIVDSVPERQTRKKSDLVYSKDTILVNLVQDSFELEHYRFVGFISDREMRIEAVLNNFKKWPGNCACDVIKSEISRFDRLNDSKEAALRNWLQHIELNEILKIVFDLKTWYKSYLFCKDYPESALQKILLTDKVEYLLTFIQLYNPPPPALHAITSGYLAKIMDLNVSLPQIKILLDLLPFEHAIDICHNLLTILKNLEYLCFITDYLTDNGQDDLFLKNVRVSLKMLTVFTSHEQDLLICLIDEPLNILEVLLMNTKLDKLAAILDLLKDDKDVDKVDQLLRRYAEKSLDFRVSTNPRLSTTTSEAKLLESLDSISLASERKPFVVPELVPTKEDWVSNEDVVECMCCKQVTFSMFNRRHHCRRCGRVVCYNCSLKRMLVPCYGDILVRVCTDCYNYTFGAEKSDSGHSDASSRSLQDYWLLNDDPEHNKIIREEFSYEHAPSTSLCLSILKYHSKSDEYPKFLLDQCEIMLRLLQPNREPTQEIDYLLVIKMLKSLATAAKIHSTENIGPSMADRILSQAEVLALLAERGCLNLMPLIGAQNLYVDATVLRRLRDKLLQEEQWSLALEVSTKAGLDNMGVFAAWGKSCLKSGSLQVAREKFQRCFDKYDASLSRSDLHKSFDSKRLSSRISTSSTLSSDGKPAKDPPLLHEIVHILETKTRKVDPEVLFRARSFTDSLSGCNYAFVIHTEAALSVVNRIKNLKAITTGNCSFAVGKKCSIDPIFYTECVYYLTKYGTHLSLLDFYVRHKDFTAALRYILDHNLSSENFVELYLKSLKVGAASSLQEHMSRIDSSLDLWKEHLRHLCRHLEKSHLLNCLYQLQLYIGDYVRASMTCIRFYEDEVGSFSELANNVGHLYRGEEHLRQILEQEQWVEVASVGNISSASKDSFEERMLSNPDLVMKIDSKDVNKHIYTVKMQIEVVKFLTQREEAGVDTRRLLRQLSEFNDGSGQRPKIPTLFGSASDKINLAVMVIISGEAVEDGFALATKIIDDFKLRAIKVFCLAGKQFAKAEKYAGITQLVSCIKSTGINDAAISDMLDEMLSQAVGTLVKDNVTGTKVEDLIKLIKDKATKISAYIEAKQLKTAYFLAVKYKRTADIRRIQREAELLNMPTIKALCQKVLQTSSHSKE